MTKVIREIRINAPREQVWNALSDFGGISVFNPTVPNSYSTSKRNSGVGASRHCDLALAGASIEERVVEWIDGEKMTIEIYEGKKAPPFKTAYATIAVHEGTPDVTVVRGTFDYTLRMGPIGALMDTIMVRPQFGKSFDGLFAGLKHYVETGETVDDPKGLDLGAVQVVAV